MGIAPQQLLIGEASGESDTERPKEHEPCRNAKAIEAGDKLINNSKEREVLARGQDEPRRRHNQRDNKKPSVKPVALFADVPRIECHDCNIEPIVPVPFADPRRSYTRNFERLVLELRE